MTRMTEAANKNKKRNRGIAEGIGQLSRPACTEETGGRKCRKKHMIKSNRSISTQNGQRKKKDPSRYKNGCKQNRNSISLLRRSGRMYRRGNNVVKCVSTSSIRLGWIKRVGISPRRSGAPPYLVSCANRPGSR